MKACKDWCRTGCDPLSGHVFLFANAQHNRLKLPFLAWSGLWFCAKRLEQGRFLWLEAAGGEAKISLRREVLKLLIRGIYLAQTRQRATHPVARLPA